MINIIFLTGNLTFDEIESFHVTFNELVESDADIIIDMRNVAVMDDSGVGGLVYLFKRLCGRGRQLELINVREQPMHLLTQLRLRSTLTVRPLIKKKPKPLWRSLEDRAPFNGFRAMVSSERMSPLRNIWPRL